MSLFSFTYLLMGVFFFLVWFFLFLIREDFRKEMIIMSIFFGFCGPMADIIYYRDWWSPITINNSVFSLEAFIVGFSLGGIISVIYEEIFKDELVEKRRSAKRKQIDLGLLALILISSGAIFYGGHFLIGINSLTATTIAFLVPTIIILIRRKDLIKMSLYSGFLTLMIAMGVYSLLNLLTPGWVSAFWQFKNVPNEIIFNMPIDDIIWYF